MQLKLKNSWIKTKNACENKSRSNPILFYLFQLLEAHKRVYVAFTFRTRWLVFKFSEFFELSPFFNFSQELVPYTQGYTSEVFDTIASDL